MGWVLVGIVVVACLGVCWIGDRRRGNNLNPFGRRKDMTADRSANEARFIQGTADMQRGNDPGGSLF